MMGRNKVHILHNGFCFDMVNTRGLSKTEAHRKRLAEYNRFILEKSCRESVAEDQRNKRHKVKRSIPFSVYFELHRNGR